MILSRKKRSALEERGGDIPVPAHATMRRGRDDARAQQRFWLSETGRGELPG